MGEKIHSLNRNVCHENLEARGDATSHYQRGDDATTYFDLEHFDDLLVYVRDRRGHRVIVQNNKTDVTIYGRVSDGAGRTELVANERYEKRL